MQLEVYEDDMNRSRRVFAVVSALALNTSAAIAADGEESSKEAPLAPSSSAVINTANVVSGSAFDAGGVPIAQTRSKRPIRIADGVNLYGDAALSAGYDSNVAIGGKGQEQGSDFFTLRPTALAEARYRANTYSLAYKGEFNKYPNFSPDSVNNNDILFLAQHILDTRASLAWGASYLDRYDPVGSTDRSVGSNEADHHHDWLANATFRYGSEGAKGRFEFDAGVGGKRYQNNRAVTESGDVRNTNLGGRFYYRVAPKTQLLAEIQHTDYDYQHDVLQLDNTDVRYLVGAIWEATAATTGTVKLGQQHKDYSSNSRKDYSGFTWEAAARWKPVSYSSFDVITGRAATDPTGNTDFIVTRNVSIAWNHDWTDYVHSKLTAGQQRSRYMSSSRRDVAKVLGANVMYDFRRWLGLGLEYAFVDRDSTDDQYDYIRNIVMLKLEASF